MGILTRRSAVRVVAGMLGYLYGQRVVAAQSKVTQQYAPNRQAAVMRLVLDVDVVEIVRGGEVQRIAASEIMDALRSGSSQRS